MAPKRKAADENPTPLKSAPRTKATASGSAEKKRKIDWSEVDDFQGFTIKSVNARTQKKSRKSASKKQKTGTQPKAANHSYPGENAPLDATVVEENPFPETELNEVHVKIEPALHWENTQRYRKFTINSEEFEVGQIVFVKQAEEEEEEEEETEAKEEHAEAEDERKNVQNEEREEKPEISHWLARVLEIRAGDPSHVYLRVFWTYRPEDLPGGRQRHHGSSELIVSNHMDIIDALTVQSTADVVHWDDNPDSVATLAADHLFWRQSFDITKKLRPLSKLNTYCVDKQPCNPDEPLVQCPHCSEWLHAHCLEERAALDAYEQDRATPSQAPKKRGRPSKAHAEADISSAFEAKLVPSDTSKTRITITDKRKGQKRRQWDVDIPCLMCGKTIESAGDDAPGDDPSPSTPIAQTGDDALEDQDEDEDANSPTPDSVFGTKPADPHLSIRLKDAPTSSSHTEEAANPDTKGETATSPPPPPPPPSASPPQDPR
ncbi:hypothetical protein BDW02DRAFT_599192 [Decorospora gaudefroyi]|uniref:BAH domain-containing protein n=1 Tax=Decorospora gaudefroyi TaxID=184978 RepID=A0A6A5K6F6_9PLEO|nr:hypothetical protein BDW02DRAFT_599192 [Decorospora gaudefroyi]